MSRQDGYDLVIAEKPELARRIAHAVAGAPSSCRLPFEGGGLRVVSCIGHLLEFKEPSDVDAERYGDRSDLSSLPIMFSPWPKCPHKDKRKALEEVGRSLRGAARVIHAGDPDDEGQYLVDELLEYFGWDGPTMRVLINDNLDESIRRAFARMDDNRAHALDGKASEARSIADFCFGINESRLIQARCGHGVHLSVGRVQTPTLGLVVRRDAEILGHTAVLYAVGRAMVSLDGAEPVAFEFKPAAELLDLDGKKCSSEPALKAAMEAVLACGPGSLECAVRRESKPAPLPYNLTDLTADMSRRHKMSAKQVLDATQSLRDRHSAITYNRSDCNYLPVEEHARAPRVLGRAMENIGPARDLDFSKRGRCFNDANITAHTGIIPQETRVDMGALSTREKAVYTAIVERYAMQFAPDAVDETSVCRIEGEKGSLVHRCVREVEPGWRAVGPSPDKADKDVQEGWVDAGTHRWEARGCETKMRKTKPRPPYTEGTLIKDMSSIAKYVKDPEIARVLKEKDAGKKGEHGGIGTTATRAQTIERLKTKGYITEASGKIVSTELGRAVFNACPDDIKGADLTARWYLLCEDVRAGKAPVDVVAQSVCAAFKEHEASAYQGVSIGRGGGVRIGACPLCGADVVDPGPNAKGYTCSNNTGRMVERDGAKVWESTGTCGFTLWKKQFGKKLTQKQAADLLSARKTGKIAGFKKKDGSGTYSAALALDANGKVVLDFGPASGRSRKGGKKRMR